MTRSKSQGIYFNAEANVINTRRTPIDRSSHPLRIRWLCSLQSDRLCSSPPNMTPLISLLKTPSSLPPPSKHHSRLPRPLSSPSAPPSIHSPASPPTASPTMPTFSSLPLTRSSSMFIDHPFCKTRQTCSAPYSLDSALPRPFRPSPVQRHTLPISPTYPPC